MRLQQTLFGTTFQNPVHLAAGTCGFGRELAELVDLDALGGLVTKSVTVEPRRGNPPPRVTEFGGGMLNSIGLTNPGVDAVRERELPWLRENVRRARVWVSVAGHSAEDYARVVATLDGEDGFLGFEINLSCPNDRGLGRRPFALDPDATCRVLTAVRERTDRPILAKLAPNAPDPAAVMRAAEDAGADGLTLVNTLPGLVLDPETGRDRLGAGKGGMSGPALRPVGVLAVREATEVTRLPLVGVGGIASTDDALEYLRAGAVLVQVGTASFADPRAALRVVEGLGRWGGGRDGSALSEVVGGGERPAARPDPVRVRAARGLE